MDILSLTTTQKIRAVLGIDDHDYNDTKFTDLDLTSELAVHLTTWLPLWATLLEDESDDADIDRQVLALQIYAKYYSARVVFTAAPMAFLKSRTDGEVESVRFDDKAMESLKAELDFQVQKRMKDVLDITTEFTPDTLSSTGTYTQFSRVANSRDIISE